MSQGFYYALCTVLALLTLASAFPQQGAQSVFTSFHFDEASWSSIRTNGTWVVEFYSPYCGHCQAFAPTWHSVEDSLKLDSAAHGVYFGQVNCIVNADLCMTENIRAYPTIRVYERDKSPDAFQGARSFDSVSEFIKAHYGPLLEETDETFQEQHIEVVDTPEESPSDPELEQEEASPVVNAASTTEDDHPTAAEKRPLQDPIAAEKRPLQDPIAVEKRPPPLEKKPMAIEKKPQTLADKNLAAEVEKLTINTRPKDSELAEPLELVGTQQLDRAIESGTPLFVKFYAPWCPHCQALAPTWARLASRVGKHIRICKVNCETSDNYELCRRERVVAYPTLVYYAGASSKYYEGSRDLSSLEAFAVKASHTGYQRQLTQTEHLKDVIASESVVYLFVYDPAMYGELLSYVQSIASDLTGIAPLYIIPKSAAGSLIPLHAVPGIYVLKSHRSAPVAYLDISKHTLIETKDWLVTHGFPAPTILSKDTYPLLFNSEMEKPPLLAFVILSKSILGDEYTAQKDRAYYLAREWEGLQRESISQPENGTLDRVNWVVVDGDEWASFIRKKFDVRLHMNKGVAFLISEPSSDKFYPVSVSESDVPFHDLDKDKLFDYIKTQIIPNKAPIKTSKWGLERWATNAWSVSSGKSPSRHILILIVLSLFLVLVYCKYVRTSKPFQPKVDTFRSFSVKVE